MPIRQYRPTSPGRRGMSVNSFEEITRSRPERSLLTPAKSKAGRNNQGRITTRHRGAGVKQRYRVIDYKRDKDGVPAKVATIEYDPNRSARIALLHYADGEKRYIIAPLGLKVGDMLLSGPEAEPRVGNAMPLKNIPQGMVIHNIELQKGRGGQLVRGAGTGAQLMAKEGDYAQVRLPSGEQRMIHILCRATVGQVGNIDHSNESIGKAGRARKMGKRPEVRGSVMNPVDHPHGGGEGRAPRGGPPRTPWGQQAMGLKTRNNKRTDKFIVRRRNASRSS